MKSVRERMDIQSAYKEAGTLRGAADGGRRPSGDR